MTIIINDFIDGAKGKGGGSGGAQEAPNTLSSTTVVRILELISEGEIGGLHTGDGRSIFINGTPLQNTDLSYNFDNAAWDIRVGLPSQPYMPGFPSSSAQVGVGIDVLDATPVTQTVSSYQVDSVKVAITLPDGLVNQDTSNGNLNGSSVTFALDRKPTSSGTWEQYASVTITGKTTTAYAAQYYMPRPAGAEVSWDVRVRRVTPESAVTSVRNKVRFEYLVETEEVKLEYENSAYIGIAIDARSAGSQVPVRSYLVKGIKCKIPSNYDPLTGVYTGQWNGSFNVATTDNPAWILYDLLTNTRYGMGRYGITESQVDKFSFYDAGVFCDGLVQDGKGGSERRFTFNTVITAASDAYQLLQNVAGMMNATLVYVNGLISINQDRPATPVKLVTKANVIDGHFHYKSSPLPSRVTSVNVTWNDASDNKFLPRVTTVDDAAGILRYGFIAANIAAYGATTEGQAIRAGRWWLWTNLHQSEIANFKMGMNGFDLALGNVVKLYDEDYTNQTGAGRVVSSQSSSVTLDREIVVTSGVNTIEVLSPDGVTIQQRTILNGAGSWDFLIVDSPWSVNPEKYADYIITSTIAPRLFKITALKQDDSNPNFIEVETIEYE